MPFPAAVNHGIQHDGLRRCVPVIHVGDQSWVSSTHLQNGLALNQHSQPNLPVFFSLRPPPLHSILLPSLPPFLSKKFFFNLKIRYDREGKKNVIHYNHRKEKTVISFFLILKILSIKEMILEKENDILTYLQTWFSSEGNYTWQDITISRASQQWLFPFLQQWERFYDWVSKCAILTNYKQSSIFKKIGLLLSKSATAEWF